MSSNNHPYRGAMGSSLTSGAGDHVGTRDNTHDSYGGSNTFSDARGVDTTNSESYGRSSGMDPRMTQAGMGSGTTHSQLGSEQINATTNRPYGQPAGSGYYDPSRLNTSASSATGGMPGLGSELHSATTATGPNSGRGIHAEPYYHQGTMGSGIPTSGSATGTGMSTHTSGLSGHHGHHTSHHDHSHHHENVTDKKHCTMCHMVDERARQIDSTGETTTTTSGTSGMGKTTGANIMSGTSMPASGSPATDLGQDATTVTHEGPSYRHLRPGETVIEHETRVHRGIAPGEKFGHDTSGMGTTADKTGMSTGHTGKMGMGTSGMGTTGMAATATGMGHGVPMGSTTGLSSGVAGGGAGAAGAAGAGAKGPSMTDKVIGGAEKMAGKVTSNEEMLRRGEEKLAGTTASSKN